MKLLQLCAGQIRLNEPLPWNVRNAPGELLLTKGFVITTQRQLEALLERGVYVDESDYERARRESPPDVVRDSPFDAWFEVTRKIGALLRAPHSANNFASQLDALTSEVTALSLRDADLAGFALLHMSHVGYPVLHSVHTAYLSVLVCRRLNMSEADCRTAVNVALTMNLSMIELQGRLCEQTEPLSADQRNVVHSHPRHSRELLEQLGIDNATWLQAVEQHHERPAGGGYPHGVCDPSRIANGETAVVVRRGLTANTPQVYSLTNGQGIAFAEPLRRDTHTDRFKAVAPVASANVLVRFDRERLFGVAA